MSGVFSHVVNARAAASTAAAQSSSDAEAAVPTTAPDVGLRTSNVAPVLAGRHSPSMKRGVNGRDIVGCR